MRYLFLLITVSSLSACSAFQQDPNAIAWDSMSYGQPGAFDAGLLKMGK